MTIMKLQKAIVLALFISIIVVGCSKTPMIQGEWYGSVTRDSDDREISKSVLKFDGENLQVLSNALYPASLSRLKFTEMKDGIYYYQNDSVKLNLQIELRNDTLFATGINFQLTAIQDSIQSAQFVINHQDRVMPINADTYVLGYWEGNIYRSSDNKLLSRIAMQTNLDSLQIYANAISGKDNIAWELTGYNPNNDTFTCKSPNLEWTMQNRNEDIRLAGDGCYALLTPVAKFDNSFFKNKSVSPNPNMYLAGNKYSGKLILSGSYTVASLVADIFMEIEILDNERLRIKSVTKTTGDMAMLMMFSGQLPDKTEVEEHRYTISNNILQFGKNDKFNIRENGEVLYQKMPQGSIELRKGAVITGANKKRELRYATCSTCGGSGRQRKFSTAQQRNIAGTCDYCNGTGQRVVYE